MADELALDLLDAFTAAPYEPMTFPHFRPRLREATVQGPSVAIGAWSGSQRVGLTLARIAPDGRLATVLSVFVAPTHRGRGIGTALLARLETELRGRGCTELELAYLTGTPSTPAVDRLLEKRRWSVPHPRMLLGQGDRRVLEAPWMSRCRLPAAFSVFPWCELSADDRRAMRSQQELRYPEMLSPFHDEEALDPVNSLGLRYQGQVVGWLITHRVSPDVLRYTSFFVRADCRDKGAGLPMLAEAFRRHSQSLGPDTVGVFAVWRDNERMVRFVRRLTPFLLSVRETRGSGKGLD